VSTAQVEAQKAQLDAEAKRIERPLERQSNQVLGHAGDLEARVTQLAGDRKELEAAEESAERSAHFAAKMGNGASSTDEPVDIVTKTAPGREVAPLVISKSAAKSLYNAGENGSRRSVKCVRVRLRSCAAAAGPRYRRASLQGSVARSLAGPRHRCSDPPLRAASPGRAGHEGPTVIVGRNGMRLLTQRAWTKARNNLQRLRTTGSHRT
jgi:hypothetical protein